jgi:hypothetical protein
VVGGVLFDACRSVFSPCQMHSRIAFVPNSVRYIRPGQRSSATHLGGWSRRVWIKLENLSAALEADEKETDR